MNKIAIGIDPGFVNLGYSIVDLESLKVLTFGEIVSKENIFEDKLLNIFNNLSFLFSNYKPDTLIYERNVFMGKGSNGEKIQKALGVLSLIARQYNCEILYYTPKEIKKSVAKKGDADKEHVARCVSKFFNIENSYSSNHASDSLACIVTFLEKQKDE